MMIAASDSFPHSGRPRSFCSHLAFPKMAVAQRSESDSRLKLRSTVPERNERSTCFAPAVPPCVWLANQTPAAALRDKASLGGSFRLSLSLPWLTSGTANTPAALHPTVRHRPVRRSSRLVVLALRWPYLLFPNDFLRRSNVLPEELPQRQMDGDHDGVPCEQQWCTGPIAK